MPIRRSNTGSPRPRTVTRSVDDWGTIEWWPPLTVGGRGRPAARRAGGLPDLPQQGPAADADRRATRVDRRRGRADTASGYYYFVAACPGGERDGSHYFAHEHDRAPGQHRQGQRRVPGLTVTAPLRTVAVYPRRSHRTGHEDALDRHRRRQEGRHHRAGRPAHEGPGLDPHQDGAAARPRCG